MAKKTICKLEMIKVKLEVKRVNNDIAIELSCMLLFITRLEDQKHLGDSQAIASKV